MITLHENTTHTVEFQLGPFPGKAHQFGGVWSATVYLNDEMRERIGEGSHVDMDTAIDLAKADCLALRTKLNTIDLVTCALLHLEVAQLLEEHPQLRRTP